MMNLGMDVIISAIKEAIEKEIENGNKKFIICPYGEIGIKTKEILNNAYGIEEVLIIDNHLSKFNEKIHSIREISQKDYRDCKVLLSVLNENIVKEVQTELKGIFHESQIIDVQLKNRGINTTELDFRTNVGRMSSGPLCNNRFVERVGSFCQFAPGVDVVPNHQTNYITCHNFLTDDKILNEYYGEEYKTERNDLIIKGIIGRAKVNKVRRITIGNDVWLGENVLITNGSNIGNGVIAGAGAVITKDVPDYAVVVGVPARIIKYRYNIREIESLNRIKWWDWSYEEIRERSDDFYLPIEEFCLKYDREYKPSLNDEDSKREININIGLIDFDNKIIRY